MKASLIIAGSFIVGSAIGYFGGKAVVKRLPDTFTFCGIRATRRTR